MLSESTAQTLLEALCDRSILVLDSEAHKFFLLPLSVQFIRSNCREAVNETGETLATNAFTLIVRFGGVTNYGGF